MCVRDDPILKIQEPGLSVSKFAEMMLTVEPAEMGDMGHYFCDKMYKMVKFHKELKSEALFHNMHQMSLDVDNPFFRFTTNFFPDVSSETAGHVFQFFLKYFLKKTLEFCMPPKENFVDVRKISMTKDEEATLRYVAGFVVFSLKKRLKAKNSPQTKATINLFNQLTTKEDENLNENVSVKDYTSHWVDQVNRGGLLIVGDEFYAFIKLMENLARLILNKNLLVRYCGDDIRKVIVDRFSKNRILQDKWSNLSSTLRNKELGLKILRSIFWKWANLRAHAFVKNWIEIRRLTLYKKGHEVSEKAEPAMRKTLRAKRKVKNTNIQQCAKDKVAKAKKCLQKKK